MANKPFNIQYFTYIYLRARKLSCCQIV